MTALQFAELLELIYQTPSGTDAWELLAARLGELLQSTSSLFIYDSISKSVVVDMSKGFESNYIESYKERYVSINPLIPGTLALPSGKVARMFEAVPKESIEQTEYYNDWLAPQRLKFAMGTHLSVGMRTSMFVAFHRPRGARDYSDETMEFVTRLVPHFKRVLDISNRFRLQDALKIAQTRGLDQLGLGVIGLDRRCSIYDLSPKAEELIKLSLGLNLRFGRLSIDSHDTDHYFQHLVAKVIDERVAHPIEIPLKTGERLDGVIVPTHHHSGSTVSNIQALLLINFKNVSSRQTVEALSKVFRLTQAESHLLRALADGKTVSEYSHIKHLSRNTVRSQLQTLFQKTGVSRQADLVRLVYNPNSI
jgi:DNA-binding CsgD family transcriptional regulator